MMNNDPQRILERARLRRVEFEQHIRTLEDDLETEDHHLLEKETEKVKWNISYEEEEKENADIISPSKYGLRNTVKSKLVKLGKLYAGEEVSSPIHKSNENETTSPLSDLCAGKLSQARSARLAALANTINNWEDDLSHSKRTSPSKEQVKPKVLGIRKVKEVIPTSSNNMVTPKKETRKIVIADSIAKTLEAQGFQRCESKQHLVYDYSSPSKSPAKCLNKSTDSPVKCISKPSSPLKVSPNKNISSTGISDMQKDKSSPVPSHRYVKPSPSFEVLKIAAKYETSSIPKNTAVKDPTELSIADRKALFERGDNGTAILPKAPFAMAVPTKVLRSDENKNNAHQKTPTSKIIPGVPKTKLISSPNRFNTEETERPIVRDNVTREILERRMEIENLRNRWDQKRREVEDKLPVDTKKSQSNLNSPQKGSIIPSAPPLPSDDYLSPRHRNNSQTEELVSPTSRQRKERESSISPGVKMVLEGIKPIRVSPPKGLYPSISDIETDSDVLEEDKQSDLDTISEADENENSYTGESTDETTPNSSIESENSAMSFGRHIVASSRDNSRSNLKRPAIVSAIPKIPTSSSIASTYSISITSETTDISSGGSQHDITADESRVLHEIDDFLDEALGEPTPPKKLKETSNVKDAPSSVNLQSRKQYPITTQYQPQTPEQNMDYESHVSDADLVPPNKRTKENDGTPLVYTVSVYRRQQNNLIKTPVKTKIQRDVVKPEVVVEPVVLPVEKSPQPDEKLVEQRMEELQIEIKRQLATISQASQALNLCMSSIEFSGSPEELEAEKLLLLATSRRIAATHELERITVEKKLYPVGKPSISEDGSLKIESLSVRAKRIPSALDETIHLLCLVKNGCTVQATEILPLTRQALTDNSRLVFKKPIQIDHVRHNMQTTVEVYALTNKSLMHLHHVRGEKDKLKMTPKKNAKKENKRHFGVVESPAGPNAVRSPSFQMVGFVVFSLKDITRNNFTLNKVPGNAPIEGFLEMKVKGQVNLSNLRHEGFLTIFQEIGGFGAWKRAWCILRGQQLSFCTYADPKRALASCFETIDLSECITREVGLAPKTLCVRADTIMLECKRIGEQTVQYLLSADCMKERLEWCHVINKILDLQRLWNPLN